MTDLIREQIALLKRGELCRDDPCRAIEPGICPCATAADTMEKLLAFYEEADGIIAESHGVDGWHLNGDVASWGEFSDLIAASNAIAAVEAQE